MVRTTMRADIKMELFNLRPPALLALLDHVITSMDGNPVFTNPTPAIPVLRTLSEELRDLISDSTDGSSSARAQRDAKVLAVRDALRATSAYVRSACNGDAVKLSTSGFPLRKTPSPVTVVEVPKNLVAKRTSCSGEVKLRWGRTLGARMFRVERSEIDPASGQAVWTSIGFISHQHFYAKELTPYAPYWFRVIAVGKDHEGLPSDVVLGRAA